MKKRNKVMKYITITMSGAVFGVGVAFAFRSAGIDNIFEQVAAQSMLPQKSVYLSEPIDIFSNENETDAAVYIESEPSHEQSQTNANAVETETMQRVDEKRNTEPASELSTAAEKILQETERNSIELKTESNTRPNTTDDATVNDVIKRINEVRASVGVSSVKYDWTLNQMAQVRAIENAENNFFKAQNGRHLRPDGRAASTICNDYGQYGNFGEVMGRYQMTTAEIVDGWVNSASHYACITNSIYKRIGIGYEADSEGRIYWVAILMD